MTDENARTFNPRSYLRRVQGGAEYLDVKWRIMWFRSEHPDGTITSEMISHDPQAQLAIFQATASWPGGGSATDIGSETREDFRDYIEKASTKAIGRALGALGYGTQFATDHEMDNADGSPHVVDSPVERAPHESRPPAASGNGPYASSAATGKQVKFLYAIAREAGLSEDALNDRLRAKYAVENADMLTRGQASEAIEALKQWSESHGAEPSPGRS